MSTENDPIIKKLNTEFMFLLHFSWFWWIAPSTNFKLTKWMETYDTHCVSLFLVRILLHSDWMRSKSSNSVRIQEYTDQKKLRIWTLFTQWQQVTDTNIKEANNWKISQLKISLKISQFTIILKTIIARLNNGRRNGAMDIFLETWDP